ncbi:MAG: dihydropteroate synthase [Actinomycetales bacterium]|nr:dihydropteroate synthase [Actinomycetales bacterium]
MLDGVPDRHQPLPAGPLAIRDRVFAPDRLLVMAIVNRTPDSFFDQGRFMDDAAAFAHVEAAVAAGADLVDVGGVRAGPGPEVDAGTELARVVPFVAELRRRYPDLLLSVDTWRPEIADAACSAGADLVNDAWQGAEPRIAEVAARHGAGLVVSHTGGHAPRQDPHRVQYADVVADVLATVTGLAERAVAVGVARDRILVDAAFDFGKNTYHSLAVAAATDRLVATGWPVLCAVSNKKFVAEAVGWDGDKPGRLPATLAATAVLAWHGARVFRAHDVLATRHALDMVTALRTGVPRIALRALA